MCSRIGAENSATGSGSVERYSAGKHSHKQCNHQKSHLYTAKLKTAGGGVGVVCCLRATLNEETDMFVPIQHSGQHRQTSMRPEPSGKWLGLGARDLIGRQQREAGRTRRPTTEQLIQDDKKRGGVVCTLLGASETVFWRIHASFGWINSGTCHGFFAVPDLPTK